MLQVENEELGCLQAVVAAECSFALLQTLEMPPCLGTHHRSCLLCSLLGPSLPGWALGFGVWHGAALTPHEPLWELSPGLPVPAGPAAALQHQCGFLWVGKL